MAPHIRSHRAPCSCFQKVSLQLSSEQSGRWCRDYAAGLEKSSTGEVQRLQKLCRHNCWVFAAPRKSKRQSRESVESVLKKIRYNYCRSVATVPKPCQLFFGVIAYCQNRYFIYFRELASHRRDMTLRAIHIRFKIKIMVFYEVWLKSA